MELKHKDLVGQKKERGGVGVNIVLWKNAEGWVPSNYTE